VDTYNPDLFLRKLTIFISIQTRGVVLREREREKKNLSIRMPVRRTGLFRYHSQHAGKACDPANHDAFVTNFSQADDSSSVSDQRYVVHGCMQLITSSPPHKNEKK